MRKFTQAVLAFVVVALSGYDLFVYRTAGVDATISAVSLDFAREWPIAAVAIGVVVGHLFWPQTKRTAHVHADPTVPLVGDPSDERPV